MKELIWKIVFAVSVVAIVIAGINIAILNKEYRAGINEYSKLETMVEVKHESEEPVLQAANPIVATQEVEEVEDVIAFDMEIDFEALRAINEDLVGWIYYEPLELSYPIVRGNDNDYYTHYTFEKEQNSSAAIFMDFLNKPDFSHFNTIIYGHNMRNGTMFGSLKKLLADTSIIEKNPYFYIITEDKIFMYEIFAGYITVSTSHTYDFTQSLEEEQEYLNYIKDVATYYWDKDYLDVPITEATEDNIKIATLSTCHGLHSTNRTVIHGLLIAQEDR